MIKKFEIETNNFDKCSMNSVDNSDDTVGYAIETLFSVEDDIYINWNGFKIPLSLKYDVSDIWNDVILMVKNIIKGTEKEFTIHFPSSTFFAAWVFSVDSDILTIKAYWTTVNLEKEDLLRLRENNMPLVIDKKEFLEEWYKILIPMKRVILMSNYNIKKLKNFKQSFSVLE